LLNFYKAEIIKYLRKSHSCITFYKLLLPTEKIYAHMMELLNFNKVSTKVIRKRNSKKELFEFDVCGII